MNPNFPAYKMNDVATWPPKEKEHVEKVMKDLFGENLVCLVNLYHSQTLEQFLVELVKQYNKRHHKEQLKQKQTINLKLRQPLKLKPKYAQFILN